MYVFAARNGPIERGPLVNVEVARRGAWIEAEPIPDSLEHERRRNVTEPTSCECAAHELLEIASLVEIDERNDTPRDPKQCSIDRGHRLEATRG